MKLSFEEGMARLQEIASQLEMGNLPIDDSLKLYEEATKIVSFCTQLLEKSKLRISVIEQTLQKGEKNEQAD